MRDPSQTEIVHLDNPLPDWMLRGQFILLVVSVVLLFWLTWISGGRDAFYDSRETKNARWQAVFDANSVVETGVLSRAGAQRRTLPAA